MIEEAANAPASSMRVSPDCSLALRAKSMVAAVEERVRSFAPKRAEEYARMLVGMIRGIAHWRCEHGGDMSADAALIAEAFLHGIAPR